jgi:hypothetical protein
MRQMTGISTLVLMCIGLIHSSSANQMIGHANQTIRHASGYVYTDSECSSLANGAFVEAIITYLTFMLNTLGLACVPDIR